MNKFCMAGLLVAGLSGLVCAQGAQEAAKAQGKTKAETAQAAVSD